MKEPDTKTVYDMKNAKFAMEKEIEASIEKFSKEYSVIVDRINLQNSWTLGHGLISIHVSAEIKL